MKLTMLVCCHKEDIMATAEPYMPLQVGKDISKIDLNIQGDNTGDNISCKNQSYCELTGMYWAWKNLKTSIMSVYVTIDDILIFTGSANVDSQ